MDDSKRKEIVDTTETILKTFATNYARTYKNLLIQKVRRDVDGAAWILYQCKVSWRQTLV